MFEEEIKTFERPITIRAVCAGEKFWEILEVKIAYKKARQSLEGLLNSRFVVIELQAHLWKMNAVWGQRQKIVSILGIILILQTSQIQKSIAHCAVRC